MCGTTFLPKRPQHTRCDRCQEEHSKQRKKERKKAKDKEGKRKPKQKPDKDRRVHVTHLEDESDEHDSDEDQEENREGTSFSCICSTRATSPSDGLIYLDNCSNLNVIRDGVLALNARKEKVATRISGSIPGTLTSQVSAELGDLGRGCHDPQFSRNSYLKTRQLERGTELPGTPRWMISTTCSRRDVNP